MGFGLELILGGVIAGYGYFKSRRFVRERLRFVEAVHRPAAPIVVGVATTVIVSVLPVLGVVTGVMAGVGLAAGVSHGAKDSKRLPPA